MKALQLLFLSIGLSLGFLPSARAQATRASVRVSGVAAKTDNATWREGLVGFGLRGLVAQAIYDSRRFDVIEENVALLRFARHEKARDTSNDILISGEVEAFSTAGQSKRKNTPAPPRPMPSGKGGIKVPFFETGAAVTTIRVNLRASRGGATVAQAEGEGKASWSKTVLLKDQGLPFLPSLVSPALQDAVHLAVTQLVEQLAKDVAATPLTTMRASDAVVPLAMAPLTLDPAVAEAYPVLCKRRVAMGLQSVLELAVRDDKRCSLMESDPEALRAAAEQWEVGHGVLDAPPGATAATTQNEISPDALPTGNSGVPSVLPVTADVPESQEPATRGSTVQPHWLIYAELFSFSRSVSEKNSSFKGQNVVSVGIQLRALDPASPIPSCRISSAIYQVGGDWKDWNWDEGGADINWKQDLVGQAVQGATAKAWQVLWPELVH